MEKKAEKLSIKTLPKGAIIGIVILLPCFGFLLGMGYQKDLDGILALYTPPPIQQFPSPATATIQTNNTTNMCSTDNDCALYNPQMANNSTLCCHNQNMLCTQDQSKITAINKEYYNEQVKNLCKPKTICPLYLMMCPAKIQQAINKLKAKCVQHVCQVAHI